MNDEVTIVRSRLSRLPIFTSDFARRAEVTRLGGLTNLVFHVRDAEHNCVLRIPGAGTEEYINRAHEHQAAQEAARTGVAPEVLFFDSTGLMVTRFIERTETMTPALFKSRSGAPGRAGDVLRKLHDSGSRFDFRFELFSMIDGYLKVLAGKDVAFPSGYHGVLRQAEAVRGALAARPLPLTACHCDPLCENFLDTGERMWIVDWEYSGMNDPLWDLGDLSVEGSFDATQDEELLRSYFGRPPTSPERGRVVIYKAMCDVLWTLWGLIQHANRNPVDDFWAYACRRFGRCKNLMDDREFDSHLSAVARG